MTGCFSRTAAAATAAVFLGWGCSSSYVPLIHTGSSLNIHNTYWDHFDGGMEVGRVYHYSNRKYDRKLHFRVSEVLPDGKVLVERLAEQGKIEEENIDISEGCRFLIATSQPYADGAKLREGDYRCLGNARYEGKDGVSRTAYLLEDVRHPRNDGGAAPGTTGKKEERNSPPESLIQGNSPCVPLRMPEDSLNICNTFWDHFTGSLETGRVYHYSNQGFCRELHYKVVRSEPGMGALVARKAASGKIDGEIRDMCAAAVFLVVSGHSYADGESLKDGGYRCLGTYKYARGTDSEQTLYVLMDVQNPGVLPKDLKRMEKSGEKDGKAEFSI